MSFIKNIFCILSATIKFVHQSSPMLNPIIGLKTFSVKTSFLYSAPHKKPSMLPNIRSLRYFVLPSNEVAFFGRKHYFFLL